MGLTLVSIVFVTLVVLYLYLTRNFKYWQKRKIPCPDGALPGVGHFWDFVIQKHSFAVCCHNIYKAYNNHSMVGLYNCTSPALMVLEPELVKTVMQTNFVSFHKNSFELDPELDPLLANNPFFSYGEKWTLGRKRLTYAFSSMRLKILLENVKQACEKFEKYMDKKLSKTGKIEVQLKDLSSRFTAQVVAAAGFGVDGLCFNDEKENESFYTMGKSFLEPSTINNIIFSLLFFMPMMNKIFRTSFLPKKIDKFFRTLVVDIMEQRRTGDGTPRFDFLQLMAELERTEKNKIDLDALAAYAISFFIDGYETSSVVLSFVNFQLANNPKVQEKLREEVVSVLNKYDGIITYDALKDMTYMDQVINESMRLAPVLGNMSKICTEEFELKGSDGLTCRMKPGDEIVIPVYGLHEDARYWENPKVFDPERFSPDRKHTLERFAFLPFGEGPRICVGMRMALLQIKAFLATFLKKYSLEHSPKTQLPLIMAAHLLTSPKGGLWAFIREI